MTSTFPSPGSARQSGPDPTVAQAMHIGVIEVSPQATLVEVAARMAGARIHCLVVAPPVAPEGPGDWGIVSDLDLMAAVAAGDERALAGRIAATDAPVVAPAESVRRAAQLMAEHGVAHLLVASSASDYPIGVISSLDVAAAVATRQNGG